MPYTKGDVSASEILTDDDHIYPSHVDELRRGTSFNAIVVGKDKEYDTVYDALATLPAGGGVVVIEAGYACQETQPIVIGQDDITIIIESGAEWKAGDDDDDYTSFVDAQGSTWKIFVYNNEYDNFNLINRGVININEGAQGVVVRNSENSHYNGYGGLIKDGHDGIIYVDVDRCTVRGLYVSACTGGAFGAEGMQYSRIYDVVGFADGETLDDVVDFNAYCRYNEVVNVTGYNMVEEIVDINASPDNTFRNIRAFGTIPRRILNMTDTSGTRLTTRTPLTNSSNNKIIGVYGQASLEAIKIYGVAKNVSITEFIVGSTSDSLSVIYAISATGDNDGLTLRGMITNGVYTGLKILANSGANTNINLDLQIAGVTAGWAANIDYCNNLSGKITVESCSSGIIIGSNCNYANMALIARACTYDGIELGTQFSNFNIVSRRNNIGLELKNSNITVRGLSEGNTTNDLVTTSTATSIDVDNLVYDSSSIDGSTTYSKVNRGSASVSDTDTITHKLDTTPTYVNLTTSVDKHIVVATAISATTITVGLHDDAGNAIGSNETVYWEAKV